MSSAPTLLAFLSTYKSPRQSASRGRLHPCFINFFSSLSLYISPPSLPALVINWVSPSLYQYCLTFCSLFSFYLVSLALPLSSFIPYPSFHLFILLPSLPLPGCSQLVLETYNVPELSAGVNCTFEDLSEMDGLVVGNQIQCYSPAAKEVPRIITENGEQSPKTKLGGTAFLPPGRALRTDVGGLREPMGWRKGCR